MAYLVFLLVAALAVSVCSQDILTTKLSNDFDFPFVGMGIGNLQHELTEEVVINGLQPNLDIQLIDTAHASQNEGILAQAIVNSDNKLRQSRKTNFKKSDSLPPIHIVTKVWYTHLGYERTKISVKETLDELSSVNTRQVYVHMLLHWPRCNDAIEWMNCAQEEEQLPQHIKDAGSPPHLNKDTAWKDSWRALEEVYEEFSAKRISIGKNVQPIIASIGVSNFEIDDMRALSSIAKIQPHVYQGDVWKVFHDPVLFRHLHDNNIFFQAYGVMNRIMGGREDAPSAFSVLSDIAREIASTLHSFGDYHEKSLVVTEATVLLAFCVQRGIGVIPRASSASHRRENAPDAIAAVIPLLTSTHINQLGLAVPALMKGEELHASIAFMNSLPGPIQIHWIHSDTGEEVLVKDVLQSGAVEIIKSHPGHRFVAYDTEREVRREVSVDVGYGERQHYSVEL
jgi:diketogulonate reductase-like aldo/keto reductase